MSYRKYVVTLLAFALPVAASTPSLADQPQTITISSAHSPILRDGTLQGCAINFEVGRNDPQYNQGKLVYITGSLNFTAYPNTPPFFALKLGVKAVGDDQYHAPADAFLIDRYATNKDDFAKRVEGEVPGFAMFMFRPGASTLKSAIESVGRERTLSFGYAMDAGGMNAVVPVELRMRQLNFDDPAKSQVDDQIAGQWVSCIQALTNTAKDNLRGH